MLPNGTQKSTIMGPTLSPSLPSPLDPSVCIYMCVSVCGSAHLQLLLSLQGKLFEGFDDDPGVGAVVDKDGGAPHPGLQVVDGQRYVLSVVLEQRRRRRKKKTGIETRQ